MLSLYTMWRSSAAYRVRIALHVKGLSYTSIPKSFAAAEHKAADYIAVNPQGLIPSLVDDGHVIPQSLAIIEYLDERHPLPRLLPSKALQRAEVRSMALSIACDIHPLNNLRVLNYLRDRLGHDQNTVDMWYRHWIAEGFSGFEALCQRYSGDGKHCYGEEITLADVCLVPQVANARRLKCDLSQYPALTAIAQALEAQPAFIAAAPDRQADAPQEK